MIDRVTVATVQPSWKRLGIVEDVQQEIGRYLRLARTKGADVVVLPEHVGHLLALPLAGTVADGVRGNLLKKSMDRSSVWGRLMRTLSGGAADMLGGLAAALPQLLNQHSEQYRDLYVDLFGTAAREYGVYLVAGSIHLRNANGDVEICSGVFDRTGTLLGWQTKLHVSPGLVDLAIPGNELAIFETNFGRLGVLIGSDVLYPELTRALAYRGVTAIACPAAVTTTAEWQQLRIALNARAQENQLFLAQSFLIGENELRLRAGDVFQGRSAVTAPVQLTPHQDGVLIEVGAANAEAVVSAEWDFVALRDIWETASVRPRAEMRGSLFEELLRFDYESGATIDERVRSLEAADAQPAFPDVEPEEEPESAVATEPTAADREPEEADEVEEEASAAEASIQNDDHDESLLEEQPDTVPAEADSDQPDSEDNQTVES